MPVRLSVQVQNARLVPKKFEDLAAETPAIAEGRMYGRMQSALKKITTYPAPNTRHMIFVSAKQRRYVMWAIRNHVIVVPYQRSGNYGRGFRIEKIKPEGKSAGGYRLVGFVPYAKWVGGTAYGTEQARIHQGRWTLIRDAMDQSVQGLPEEIRGNIVMVARRRGFS